MRHHTLFIQPSLPVIAGPSMLDDKALALETAEGLKNICSQLGIPFIFKAAFKRINSALAEEFTGLGPEVALKQLKAIGKKFQVMVQTDVYNELDAFIAAKYADILQIPAYLFRDTSLLKAAARTSRIVNIRKGMTIAGRNMAEAVQKIRNDGFNDILLTERGTMHGYDDVIIDIRNISIMKKNNTPLFIDLSNALPGAGKGMKEQEALQTALVLGKACIAAGADGITLDAHIRPAMAKNQEGHCFQVSSLPYLLGELNNFKKWLQQQSPIV